MSRYGYKPEGGFVVLAVVDVIYSEELAEKICTRLASGESLISICKAEDMPGESRVRQWAVDNSEGFAVRYARARDMGLDHHADEILELADTSRIGTKSVTKPTGAEITEGDMVERSRLQIEARKWYLSKLAPKRYGDKLEVDHAIRVEIVKNW